MRRNLANLVVDRGVAGAVEQPDLSFRELANQSFDYGTDGSV